MSEENSGTCLKCGELVETKDGLDDSDYCDLCAQELVVELQSKCAEKDAEIARLLEKLETARKALNIISDSKLSCLGTICRIEARKALKQIGE